MTHPEHVRTVRAPELVYGAGGIRADDAAETFHEASKVYPRLAAAQMPGAALLRARRDLQVSAQRSVRRHPELDWIELPEPRLPETPLARVLHERESQREFGEEPLDLSAVGALLHAAYGVTRTDPSGQSFRCVPSGGALYPLELYVAAARVDGLEPGVYHFDPLRRCVGRLHAADGLRRLGAASAYPEITDGCAVTVYVAAVFWRTRFKYGLRGYRFALLEAGHVVQNLVLTATALGLASVPLGGYYDRSVDEVLELDGVNDSTIYAACIGSRP